MIVAIVLIESIALVTVVEMVRLTGVHDSIYLLMIIHYISGVAHHTMYPYAPREPEHWQSARAGSPMRFCKDRFGHRHLARAGNPTKIAQAVWATDIWPTQVAEIVLLRRLGESTRGEGRCPRPFRPGRLSQLRTPDALRREMDTDAGRQGEWVGTFCPDRLSQARGP